LTKEFLGAHKVEFESVVISEQRERWIADGSPPVPTLVIDGTAHILQHPSQAGLLLGLETPPALRDAVQVTRDIDAVAEAWLELVTAARPSAPKDAWKAFFSAKRTKMLDDIGCP